MQQDGPARRRLSSTSTILASMAKMLMAARESRYSSGVSRNSVYQVLYNMLIPCATEDDKLERSHDYIQMLFPLPEGSMFSYTAPIIDKKTMEEFRSNGHLQITLGHAFTRMVEFYGFEVVTTLDSEVPAYQAEEDVAAAARQKQAVEGRGKGKATELEGESRPSMPRITQYP